MDGSGTQSLAAQELAALEELAVLKAKLANIRGRGVAAYYDDPVGFVRDCVKFKPLKGGRPGGLAPYQAEILSDLPKLKRIAVRGPRGLGKSQLASMVILWFAVTRDAAGRDWKIITTAGSWQQLRDYLWREINKWAYTLDWERIGRPPFSPRTELMKTQLSLHHGLALASSPDTPAKLEGVHGDSVLAVLDEAKIISPNTFNSIEGAFSGAGDEEDDPDLEAFVLAISTPGEPAGRFYDIFARKEGLEDWHTRHVTLEEAIAAKRMARSWAEQRKKLWGATSALYCNHVLGEFCADDEDAIVPLSWIEAAVIRWREWDADGRPDREGPRIAGVDVATSGHDRTAVAIRYGDVITGITTYSRADTMETSGRVMQALTADSELSAIVDSRGVGSGVYHRLRELGAKCDPFDASAKATRKDRTGQLSFKNLRAAAWWHCRDLLDPAANATLALPPDDELIGDLACVHKKIFSDGKILAEPKEDVRKRIGRSTDKGDSAVMALWAAQGSWLEAYWATGECTNPKCGEVFRPDLPDGSMRTHCPRCHSKLEEPELEDA